MLKHHSPPMHCAKKIAPFLLLLFTVAIVTGACAPQAQGLPMESLTIGLVPTEINALLYVAEAQGYFASNSLQVTLKEDYESGAAAVAMLSGETDVASAAEFPISTA